MKIEKILNYPLERCYATAFLTINNEVHAVFASEAIGGSSVAFNLSDVSQYHTVWNDAGGTMNFQQCAPDHFLAIQGFYPGYNSQTARVVRVKEENTAYTYESLISLPYLHRFGIIKSGNAHYFVGCTLCSSKREREDWSDPGKIYVGIYTKDAESIELEVIKEGLTKNHGFWIQSGENHDTVYVSAEEGVYSVTPPSQDNKDWKVEKVYDAPTSEYVTFDFDGDGEHEALMIEPFHGSTVSIVKDGQKVWEDSSTQEFIHALWGGSIFGNPTALVGSRKKNADLYLLMYNHDLKCYQKLMIESGVGCANVDVIEYNQAYYIASSNHTTAHAALYKLTL